MAALAALVNQVDMARMVVVEGLEAMAGMGNRDVVVHVVRLASQARTHLQAGTASRVGTAHLASLAAGADLVTAGARDRQERGASKATEAQPVVAERRACVAGKASPARRDAMDRRGLWETLVPRARQASRAGKAGRADRGGAASPARMVTPERMASMVRRVGLANPVCVVKEARLASRVARVAQARMGSPAKMAPMAR